MVIEEVVLTNQNYFYCSHCGERINDSDILYVGQDDNLNTYIFHEECLPNNRK